MNRRRTRMTVIQKELLVNNPWCHWEAERMKTKLKKFRHGSLSICYWPSKEQYQQSENKSEFKN